MNNDRIITIIICSVAILFGIIFKTAPHFYYKHGLTALKKHNYVEARKSFKKSLFFNKKNKNYRYYYVQSLVNLSPTITIQKELFEVVTLYQNDAARQVAQDKINEWRMNVTSNIGDNYIEQAPFENGILRWDQKKFPLKINIEKNTNLNIPAYYETEISRAFSQWQNSSGFIKFEKTNNKNDADILIRISPLPNDVCSNNECRYVVGFTTPHIKKQILKQMTIILYDKDPNGNFFSDKELYNTILHEIGHALGVMGHSYSSEDLMYMSSENPNSFYAPYRSSFQYISSKDINTIKLLYKLIPNITNTPQKELDTKGLIFAPVILGTSEEISQRKLKEAQNYIKRAPNLAGGYIDLGVAYSELGNHREAIKAFKKALELAKIDDDRYVINFNIALVYLDAKKYEKALEYANLAKQISNNEEINELIANINHSKVVKK